MSIIGKQLRFNVIYELLCFTVSRHLKWQLLAVCHFSPSCLPVLCTAW